MNRGRRISIVELVGSCSVGRNHMAKRYRANWYSIYARNSIIKSRFVTRVSCLMSV